MNYSKNKINCCDWENLLHRRIIWKDFGHNILLRVTDVKNRALVLLSSPLHLRQPRVSLTVPCEERGDRERNPWLAKMVLELPINTSASPPAPSLL